MNVKPPEGWQPPALDLQLKIEAANNYGETVVLTLDGEPVEPLAAAGVSDADNRGRQRFFRVRGRCSPQPVENANAAMTTTTTTDTTTTATAITNEEIQAWNKWMTHGRAPVTSLHLAMLFAMPQADRRRFRRHLATEVIPAARRRGKPMTGADFASRLAAFVLNGGETYPP